MKVKFYDENGVEIPVLPYLFKEVRPYEPIDVLGILGETRFAWWKRVICSYSEKKTK